MWCEQDYHRFYVNESYSQHSNRIQPMKQEILRKLGIPLQMHIETSLGSAVHKQKVKPLKTLDIFAGADGHSTGLEESGSVKCKWAIELNKSAAKSFQKNHSNCKVLTEDCSHVLQQLDEEGFFPGMPSKGEVEMIIGVHHVRVSPN